jgi:peroxiredoxin
MSLTRTYRQAVAAALVLFCFAPGLARAAAVGEPAPDFTLTDTDGKVHALADLVGAQRVVVLEWFNPDCPFILKHHQHHRTMDDLAARYGEQGVIWLAINSAAAGKQGAGLERNQKARQEYKMSMPVLLDESGAVGKAYGAKTTPHMFVIAPDGTIAYAGAIDDDRSPSTLGKTNYVADALDAVLAGKPVAVEDTPAYGCSVKYGP